MKFDYKGKVNWEKPKSKKGVIRIIILMSAMMASIMVYISSTQYHEKKNAPSPTTKHKSDLAPKTETTRLKLPLSGANE